MLLSINKKTKWAVFAPYATPQRVAQLRDKITNCASFFDFWQMSIGDFSQMIENGLPDELKMHVENKEITVYEVIEILNAADKFLNDFSKALSNYKIEPEGDEITASSFCPEFKPIESMLIFTREYFGLKNFGDAEKITLLEYYLAKKDSYSKAIFQRSLQKIQLNKMKR